MMGTFGRFLEVSIPASDVLRSLAFYRSLGFAELTTGDIRPWHYAVVTDGSIAIGLHGGGIDEHALTFVRPNLARQVAALESAGHRFECRRLGAEEFNEASLRGPDGELILMIEARTWSPGETSGEADCLLGRCTGVLRACTDVGVTRSFYEAAGFLPADDVTGGAVRLHLAGVTLALDQAAVGTAASLEFTAEDPGRVARVLAERDVRLRRAGEDLLLIAPEGTRLILRSE